MDQIDSTKVTEAEVRNSMQNFDAAMDHLANKVNEGAQTVQQTVDKINMPRRALQSAKRQIAIQLAMVRKEPRPAIVFVAQALCTGLAIAVLTNLLGTRTRPRMKRA